eukprot:jgi/Mesvir1/8162/Mv12470-RA.1
MDPLFYSIAGFGALYGIFAIIWKAVGLQGKKRYESASSVMSFAHGLITLALAGKELLIHPFDLAAPNTEMQVLVMKVSTGYFLVDMMYLFSHGLTDVLYILHHFATITYMLTCLRVEHGALSCLALMVSGESTSPLQNIWLISKNCKEISHRSDRFYRYISMPYTYIYVFVRIFIGPPLCAYIIRFLITGMGSPAIPYNLAVFWSAIIVMTIIGSTMWARSLWLGLKKVRKTPMKKAD